MNAEDKSRIIQNLTYLKERLVDLDSLIDRLIENGVFQFDHRSQIENISKPTPHRQFNEFIKLLTSSPSPKAFEAFVDALEDEGYHNIAQKLQKTNPSKSISSRVTSGKLRSNTALGHYEIKDRARSSKPRKNETNTTECRNCADAVVAAMETFGKAQLKLLEDLDKQRRQDLASLEQQRQRDKQHFHNELTACLSRWEAEKVDILRKNDDAIDGLTSRIQELQKSSDEYKFLKDQYNYLQEKQKGLREKDNERVERMSRLNREKVELEKTNQQLEDEIHTLKINVKEKDRECEQLDDRNHDLTQQVEELEFEKAKLERVLNEKDKEYAELKYRVYDQYNQIQDLLQQQQQQGTPRKEEQEVEYRNTIEKQMQKLDEMHDILQTISMERTVPVLCRGLKNKAAINITGKTLGIGSKRT